MHGLQIVGRVKADDDDLLLNVTYLASDNEDELDARPFVKKMKQAGQKEVQTHVFVWGLNDKDQLGGPKGSKVPIYLILLLNCSH